MSNSTIIDIENGRGAGKFKNMANNVVRASLNWSDNTKRTQTHFSPNYLEDIEDSSVEEDAAESEENIDIERMIIRKSEGVPADIIRFNTKLLECVKLNTLDLAKDYLDNGASPNATCLMHGLSVCHLAAYFGSDRILKEVIRDGADPVRQDNNGRTPLHCSAWRGTGTCMRILLESVEMKKCIDSYYGFVDYINPLWMDSIDHNCNGLAITTRNIPCNKTALEIALGQLNFECADILLEAGARICVCKNAILEQDAKFCLSAVNSCGSTIKKSDFSDQRYLQTMEVLLQHGHRRNGRRRKVCSEFYNPKGYRIHAMYKAATLDDGVLMQHLLDAGFSPMHYDEDSLTPIHRSVIFRKIAPFKILSDAGGIEIGTLYSALNLSVTTNWLPGVAIIIKKLIKKQLPFDLPDELDNTILHLAAKRGNSTLVYNLIQIFRNYELSINEENKAGHTPLYESVRAGHAMCVKEFLHQGAILTESGYTELHEAARNGYHSVLDQLLKTTALDTRCQTLINEKDTYGLTPLHWAAHKNSVKCFERLVAAGANIATTASDGPYQGFTVLHMAAFSNSLNIIEYIYKARPNMLNTEDMENNLPFHIAIQCGHRDASSFFITKGADLSDTVHCEGKPCATMEFLSNWHYPVKYLESLFDSYVVRNEYDLDNKRSEIILNYRLFIPNSLGNSPRMKVIEAIFGNELGFDELLLHPLVASYLSLEWSRLRMTFAGIVFIHAVYLFFLTALVIDTYDDYKVNRVWEYCLWAILSIIIVMELLLFRYSKSRIYLKKLEWLQKTLSTALTIWFLLDYQIDSDRELSRILAAITILSAWVQFSLQFSRLTGGFSYRIFEKVAVRAAKVLLMFGWFLVIGFGLAFWILFQENTPFDTWGDSIIKTIVMMTSEFDYATLFEDRPFDPLWTISRLLFLTFILFISIVMMNLLLTLAISDTEDLKAEGQKQKLLEQVYFLGMLDGFAFKLVCKILPRFLKNRIYKMQLKEIALYPGRIGASKTTRYLTDKVVARVYQYCMDKEKPNENMLADVAGQIKRLDEKSEVIHTLGKSIETHFKELSKKVDKLSTVKKTKSKTVKKIRWTFNTSRKSWKRNA